MNQKKNVTRMQQKNLLTLKYQDERDGAFVKNMKQYMFQRKELNQTIIAVVCKTRK